MVEMKNALILPVLFRKKGFNFVSCGKRRLGTGLCHGDRGCRVRKANRLRQRLSFRKGAGKCSVETVTGSNGIDGFDAKPRNSLEGLRTVCQQRTVLAESDNHGSDLAIKQDSCGGFR